MHSGQWTVISEWKRWKRKLLEVEPIEAPANRARIWFRVHGKL